MPLDPTLRVLLLAISRATRAFSDGDNAALKAVNESLQPLVDAAMARILAKDTEIRRLTTALAAAQAELTAARRGPVVEWTAVESAERATRGRFLLWVRPHGWSLRLGTELVNSGDETGDAGKAACFAAYLKAAGLA